MKRTLNCERCGQGFNTSQPDSRFCGECRQAHKNERNAERARERRKERSEQGISLVVAVPDAKQCPRCGQVEAASEFGPSKDRPTGLQTYCRTCRAVRAREAHIAGKYNWTPKPKKVKTCMICGNASLRTYCSRECELENGRRKSFETNAAKKEFIERTCKECGEKFIPEYKNKRRDFCCDECSRKYSRRIGKATRRARAHGAGKIESFDPRYILKRDGWRCYICGCTTPKKLRGTKQPNAPEVDHVVPLARGGTHTEQNVRCICRSCNIKKGAKLLEQVHLSAGVQLRLL
jgi:hypothetical protein